MKVRNGGRRQPGFVDAYVDGPWHATRPAGPFGRGDGHRHRAVGAPARPHDRALPPRTRCGTAGDPESPRRDDDVRDVKNGLVPRAAKGSGGEVRILVVEGPSERHASTNKPIGVLIISGKDITRDLIKGTEIDLQFEMSESRDLTVSAHLTGTGQDFSQVFDPQPRTVPTKMLAQRAESDTLSDSVSNAWVSGRHVREPS